MNSMTWARILGLGLTCAMLMIATRASAQLSDAQLQACKEEWKPGCSCSLPVAERGSELGCYFVANAPLGTLPDVPLFWHIYAFPTSAAADAAKGENGTVVESLGQVWLYAIAEQGWRPETGERVAVIGPLHVKKGRQYTARYLEATFEPGMHTTSHRHPGPEAWYVVSGAQCLDTTEGIIVARAGESALVPEGPAMILSGIGKETRRSLVLILHDSSQPYTMLAPDWNPSGRCPKE